MIAIDASPLCWGPPSVARMVRAWLAGWPTSDGHDAPRLLWPARAAPAGVREASLLRPPAPTRSPRRMRAAMPKLLAAAGTSGLLSPWSAFPDLPAAAGPRVVTVHELPFVRHGPLEGRARGWRHRTWLRRAVAACDALITPSSATREDILTLHPGAAERVHVVPCGFDPAPWRAAQRAPTQEPYAVMVGLGHGPRGAHKKGLDVLLEAWRRAAPAGWRLVLVGRTRAALPAGVAARDRLDDAALRSLVAGARALVYPSRSEGFGYPPLEAMAAGVPVLATRAGSVPEVVGQAALLVEPGDVAALAGGLLRLAEDDDLRARLRATGAARAATYAPERAARGVIEVFAGLGVQA